MGWLVNFEESIKELLISLITSMLGELFVMTSEKFSDFTAMIGQTPQTWNPGIYSMVQSLSSTVIVPAANIILTLVVSLELFGMLVERNNMVDIEPAFLVSPELAGKFFTTVPPGKPHAWFNAPMLGSCNC